MADRNSKVEESLQALEEEMKKRYGEQDGNGQDMPSVLKPPEKVYRSYEAPAFWKKAKKWLIRGGALLAGYYLLFPASFSFPLDGKLIASEMRTIDAKVMGEIVELAKSNGDYVDAGEIIGRIESPYLRREKSRLEAETEVLVTELDGIQKPLEVEQKKLAVYKRLYEEGDLARLKFEEQEMKTEELASRYAVKEAEVQERKVRLANLEKQLEGEIIRSPIPGLITSPIQEKLNAHIKEGESICDIAFGGIRFEFRVKERAVRAIAIGQKVKIKLDAFPTDRIEGKVEDIRPIVIEDNPKPWRRVYNARILVTSLTPLPKEARLGMSAKSRIRLKKRMSRLGMWFENLF